MKDLWQNLTFAAPDLMSAMLRMEIQLLAIVLLIFLIDHRLKQWAPNLRYTLWLLALGKAL